MMISQPPRTPQADDAETPEAWASSDEHRSPGGDAASGEAEKAILDEMGGPVPDFLRAAQVLRSATDDIKEQVRTGTPPAKKGRGRSKRAPLLKLDDSLRLRQMLAEMANFTPTAAADPTSDYRPDVARRPGGAPGGVWQTSRRGRLLWMLRNSPVLVIGLVALCGLGGGLGYLALGVRASAPPAPDVYEATQEPDAPVADAETVAAPQTTATATTVETPAIAATAAAPAAPPVAATESSVAVRSFAPAPTAALRPSRPAADLNLPAPEPLAIPLDAPDASVAEETPAAPSENADLAVVDGTALNVRAEPAKGSRKLFVLSEDEQVAVLEVEQSWTRIRNADGREGWVYSTLTTTTPRKLQPGTAAPVEADKADTANTKAAQVIKRGGVTVRSGAGRGNRAVFNLSGGEAVTVLEKKNGWARIKDKRGRTGWAYADFIVGS